MVFPFVPCSSACVIGQVGSGKTQFVYKLLRSAKEMYGGDTPDKIVYCFGIQQPLLDEMSQTIPTISDHQGLPTPKMIDEFTIDRSHRLFALDDLMHRVIQDVDMELLFTQGCHHRKLSVIFITQNVFPKGSKSRTIAVSATLSWTVDDSHQNLRRRNV